MSSLWTPGGEHPVPEDDPLAGLSDDERAQAETMAEEMVAARQRVIEAPADMVVANHAMGLYELAAIHLSEEQPDLEAARLATDAMAALVEGLPGRLGEAEATLREALAQVRLAFVQVNEEQAGTD
jgi:hypothetical protein